MVDFIAEVEEELRKDDYNKLLRRWGPWMAVGAVALVAGAGFYEWYKNGADRAARAASISYIDAYNTMDDGNTAEAERQFIAIAGQAEPGYAGLSLMQASALALDEGRHNDAISLLDQAAANFTKDRHVHLAELKAAYILTDLGRYDDAMARLAPLTAKDAPYEYLARELKGHIALQQGDVRTARSEFSLLSRAPGVTEGVQERARQLLLITPALATAQDEAPDTATPDTTPEPDQGDTPDE